MTQKKINEAAKMLAENILTPVIYVCEQQDRVEFICFCDRSLDMEELAETEKLLADFLGCPAEIADIREFSESDRLDIIQSATLVHSHSPEVRQMFEMSVAADLQKAMEERTGILERSQKCCSLLLQ